MTALYSCPFIYGAVRFWGDEECEGVRVYVCVVVCQCGGGGVRGRGRGGGCMYVDKYVFVSLTAHARWRTCMSAYCACVGARVCKCVFARVHAPARVSVGKEEA